MTQLRDIVDLIKNKFNVDVETKTTTNSSFIRVLGLDSISLAQYINDNFTEIQIEINECCDYKLYNSWIEIKNVDNKFIFELDNLLSDNNCA